MVLSDTKEVFFIACLLPLRAIRVGDKVLIKKRSDFNSLKPYVDENTGEYCEPFDVPCGK